MVWIGGTIPVEAAAEIQRRLADKDTKSALKAAKAVHRQLNTPESEALLVEIYRARIGAMREEGMPVEAAALEQLVLQRYASARKPPQAAPAQPPQQEPWEKALACLSAPAVDPAEREAVLGRIRREVADLPRLAACPYLPEGHPLRQGAAAVVRAFEAVTRGPVTDEQMALPEVSHRSPLSDWKTVVRAIACFYRGDDSTCLKLLEAMDRESAAAKLAPALRALLDGGAGAGPTPAAGALLGAIRSDDSVLRRALLELDSALGDRSSKRLHEAIREAVSTCRRARPELLERLKQHISIRCVLVDYPAHRVVAAMAGHSRHDAHFWRLLARAHEMLHDNAGACSLWEEFRRNAVNEGLFAERSQEEAVLYLHMVDLLLHIADDALADIQARFPAGFVGYRDYYRNQPDSVQAAAPKPGQRPDLYFLYPERLFERICAALADSAVYARWLEYAKQCLRRGKKVDEVAMRWHEALPGDKAPLLHLMESAESRNALDKALKFLRKAEDLDALDSTIKRARLRLCVGKAMRHFGQHRFDLAENDLDEMAQLPQAREGDRAAFLAALRWFHARGAGRPDQVAHWEQETIRLFGDELTARVLLGGMSEGAGGRSIADRAPIGEPPAGNMAQAAGRICALGEDLALPLQIPAQWAGRVRKALSARDCPTDPVCLEALARAALRSEDIEAAFLASGVGLRQGGQHAARFLLLRGQSLRPWFYRRREECFTAAAELARRQRDMDLVAEVVDLRRSGPRGFAPIFHEFENTQMTGEELAQVLQRERDAAKYPTDPREGLVLRATGARTGRPVPWPEADVPVDPGEYVGSVAPEESPDDGEEDDLEQDDELEVVFDEEDEDQSFGPRDLPKGIPPDVLSVLFKLSQANNGRAPSFEDVERIVRENPGLREELLQALSGYESNGGRGTGDFGFPQSGWPRSKRDTREARRRRRKLHRHSRGR